MDIDSDDTEASNQISPPNFQLNTVIINGIQQPSDGHQVEVIIPFSNAEIPVEHHLDHVEIENSDHNYVGVPSSTISTDGRVPSLMDLTDESSRDTDSQETEETRNKGRVSRECDDDGETCPICLDSWTNSGEHRICALKCGHLFGYKCVNRWLDSQQKKSCPTCKKRVHKTDIRYIYAKKLVAVDTTELDSMKQQLDAVIEEKNKISMDISKYVCREHILNQEIAQLKKQIHDLKNDKLEPQSFTNSNYSIMQSNTLRLFKDKSLEICRQNASRVFDGSNCLDLIVASAKSPNGLFSGFGIRKINISHYKPLAFIPLHNQQIRDICFHPVNNWILTASMDKSSKVVDTVSNTVTYTTSQSMPLWSCCWDSSNQYMFYIGTQSGDVVKYDIRVTNNAVSTLSVPGDMSPVVSVASIPSGPMADLVHGGIVSCKLNSLWVFENTGSDHKRHSLSVEGPFISMKYNTTMKQLLISSRPNNRISYSRHSLCTLEKTNPDKIQCNIIHSFQGGGMQKLLSKSCFVTDKQDYVAAYQESNKCVFLWSINTGQRVCSVPAHDAVLDLGSVQNQNGNFLVSLTEKKLDFFKFC